MDLNELEQQIILLEGEELSLKALTILARIPDLKKDMEFIQNQLETMKS